MVLSHVILASPAEVKRAIEDLAAGLDTDRTRSPVLGFQPKIADKLAAAKLLAELSGWRSSKAQIEGTQAILDEILDRIGKPANKPPKPANTDDED